MIRRIVLISVAAVLVACQGGGGPTTAAVTPSVAGGTSSPSAADTGSPSASASVTGRTASPSATGPAVLTGDPLHGIALVDVRSGTTVTLGALAAEKPLLVETMAIWCTNCRGQMHEVRAAHELADFHSVSIDVEAYEVPADLAAYADQQGWDWPFVKADAATATALRDRFGTEVLFPPGMPKILFRPDGSVELLPLGVEMPAADIAALVGDG